MSADDVRVVHEALRTRGWSHVAPALGVKYRGRRNRIKCPIHNGDGENFTLDEHDGRLTWICASQCGAGDVISLIQHLRGVGFQTALREAADLGGVRLEEPGESEESRAHRELERAAYIAAIAQRDPEPELEFPPEAEIASVWDEALPVTDDREVAAYLAGRAIDPLAASVRDVLRVLAPGADLPVWARYGTRQWSATGHRILMRAFDSEGRLRSLRAWRCGGDPKTPKRLPPQDYRTRGVILANRAAQEILAGRGGPGRFVVAEGEPDFAVWGIRTSDPVLGVISGSWSRELADRIPFGSELVIRTHLDKAGEKYAREIAATCRGRWTVLRLTEAADGSRRQ